MDKRPKKPIHFELPESIIEDLKTIAEMTSQTMTDIVLEALESEIIRYKNGTKLSKPKW